MDSYTPARHDKLDSKSSTTSEDSKKVRVVGLGEYKAAAYALAEAFEDDHVSQYFVDTPDRKAWTDEQKWDLHLKIMEYITYAHILKGLVTTVGTDYGCVALWMPPGNNMDDLLTIIRSGLWRLYYKLSAEGKNRFFSEFFPLLHDTKASVLGSRDDDSYYLVYIGTRPSARGKGYAKTCIGHMTKKADVEGRPCYLESSNDINPIIYRKHGFEIVKKIYLQRDKHPIELDIMVREPATQLSSKQQQLVSSGVTTKPVKPSPASASPPSGDSKSDRNHQASAPKVKVQITANAKTQSGDKVVAGVAPSVAAAAAGAKTLKTYAVVKTDTMPAAFTHREFV